MSRSARRNAPRPFEGGGRLRRVTTVALAAGALAAGTGCREPAPPPATARNLLLVVIDTLRRDNLSTYGYERDTAPGLRRLAEEGAALDGFSTSSWTKPSVASILTGLHPLRHQAVLADALPGSALTLAERLGERGYRTLAITSNAHISPSFGFDQGFDDFEPLMREFDSGELPEPPDVSRALVERLDRLEPPFFLYLHYLDPHAPYDPETTWDGQPLPERLRERTPMKGSDLEHRRFLTREPEFVRDALDLYDGEIRGVDRDIALVLGALAERGLMEGTLIVVTSDHGEEFEEHGRMGHGKALYGESVRVPLIFHAPGVVAPAGHVAKDASVLDVLPTALDLLGVERGEELDGVSHASGLRGGRFDEAPRELLLYLDLREIGRLGALALQGSGHKLVLSRFPHSKELFDRGADPAEQASVLGEPGGVEPFALLAPRLADRYDSLVGRALPRAEAALTPDVTEALEALGYVGSSGLPEHVESPLPASLRPADERPFGLLGWEPGGPEAACLEPAAPGALSQLLHGWHGTEHGGRWTEPLATVALGRPDPGVPLALRLEGINPSDSPLRLRASLEGGRAIDSELPQGRFDVRVGLDPRGDPEPGRALLVRLERLPPLVPARVTPRGRERLGVFLTRLCLVPR